MQFDGFRLDSIRLEWFLSPMGLFAFLAVALAGCLALFLSMKREIALVRRSLQETRDTAAASVSTLSAELAELRQKGAAPEAPPAPAAQELNLISRAQALRMQNRGESSAAIASTLRLPRNEVDLLLKIQKMTTVKA